ncbi:MAG: hypothetical protein Q3976_04910 [Corynebacterium sp.]|nr:hypothetical protein [Corynebacterium sp.]
MPVIHFDCLIDPAAIPSLRTRIARVGELMQQRELISELTATDGEYPELPANVAEQLEQIFLQEHCIDRDDPQAEVLETFQPWRFSFQPTGYQGSYNQLAMQLSRLWTPPATLPRDSVLLADEARYEQAAQYPWTVSIQP